MTAASLIIPRREEIWRYLLERGRWFERGLRQRGVHASQTQTSAIIIITPTRIRFPIRRLWVSASEELFARCIELHTYSVGGSLCRPGHRDSGSRISMSILLSEPAHCAGGVFVTWDAARQPIEHHLRRGDAVLFHSDRVHNVSPVSLSIRTHRQETYFAPPFSRRPVSP